MISAVCYSCYDEPAARKLFVQRAKSKLVAADTRGAVRNLRTRGTPPRPHPPCTLPPSAHPPRTLHSHFSRVLMGRSDGFFHLPPARRNPPP